MAGNLIGHPAGLVHKISGEGAFPFELHEILADIERPRADFLGFFAAKQFGIFALEHQAATRHGYHNIVPLFDPGKQGAEIRLGSFLHGDGIPDIERRHPATLLLRHHDPHTVLF